MLCGNLTNLTLVGWLLSGTCFACHTHEPVATSDPLSHRSSCEEFAYEATRGPNWFNVRSAGPQHVLIATDWRPTPGQRFILLYVPSQEEGSPYEGPTYAEARVVAVAADGHGFATTARIAQGFPYEPTEAFGPIGNDDVVTNAHLEYAKGGEHRLDSPLGLVQAGNRHYVGPYTLLEVSYRCGDNLFAYESWLKRGGSAWRKIEAKVMRFRADQ